MTKRRKLLILTFIFFSVTAVITWFIYPAFKMYLLYTRLGTEGLTAEARILRKETRTSPSFLGIFDSRTERHLMHVEFEDLGGNFNNVVLDASKTFYDRHEVGDFVRVLYLRNDPGQCRLAAFVESTRYISKVIVICGLAVWVFVALLPAVIGVFLICRSESANEISLDIGEMRCPECGLQMEEGYVPLISGVNWRGKAEPIGLLTVFFGLPETVWWNPFKRPKLPGFRCARCKVILFKYGK